MDFSYPKIFFAALVLVFHYTIAQSFALPRIGIIIPHSGPFAEVGEDCRQGVEVARALRPTQGDFIYGDSQADPKLGIAEFRKLSQEGALSAVLASRSPIGMALNPFSLQSKVPLIGAVGHKQFTVHNLYAFQFWSTSTEEGLALSKVLIGRKQLTVAMLTSEDDWTLDVSSSFKESFLAAGGKIVFDETVPKENIDAASFITRIKQHQPAAIFLNVAIAQIPLFIRKLQEQGVQAARYSNFWAGKREVIRNATPEAMNGTGFVEMAIASEAFIVELHKRFSNQEPSAMSYSCFAGASFILQGLENSRSRDLYSALLEISTVSLAGQELPIVDRRAKFTLGLKEIQKGKVVEIRKL